MSSSKRTTNGATTLNEPKPYSTINLWKAKTLPTFPIPDNKKTHPTINAGIL